MGWNWMMLAVSVAAQGASDGWQVHMESGDKLRDQGRYREALQAYGKALSAALAPSAASAPTQPDRWAVASAHNGVGAMWLALRDFRKAETHLRQALSVFEIVSQDQPESAMVRINLVTLLRG